MVINSGYGFRCCSFDTLLQNAKDVITKCDCYCILLQNTSGFLFQNATVLFKEPTVITKCDNVLQNATFTTKWDFYYKMSWYKGNEKMSWDYFKKKTKRLIWNF